MPKAATKKGGKAEKRGKGKKGMSLAFENALRRVVLLRLCADDVVDPNAPKRGLSAYMFFANEQRENVREENPGIKFGKSAFQ